MSAPSPWFEAHSDRLAEAARLGPIVDLACGRGRHTLACAARGWPTIGIDRNAGFLTELSAAGRRLAAPPRLVRADLETGHGLPLAQGRCGAVLVFRFLARPLADAIAQALAPGGVLLYETFTRAQRDLPGGPRRDEFLLAEGELPGLFPGLELIDHCETVRRGATSNEAVASLAASRRSSRATGSRA